jgi:hypothetical protein
MESQQFQPDGSHEVTSAMVEQGILPNADEGKQ